jgi:putative aldouronate transport system substrate-binding protein
MKRKHWTTKAIPVLLATGLAAGCSGGQGEGTAANKTAEVKDDKPFEISVALRQVGDIPAKGSEFEQSVEKYTNTKLSFQWVPQSNFDEKINVMLASSEVPKILKVNYVPNILNAIRDGLFWEVGPYIKDFKNLAAQDKQFYENIQVDGKVYGIPNYRDIGRAAILYRKDWFESMGLKIPTNLDEWYSTLKALTLNDPDKNGKNDTFGTVLFKGYNSGTQPVITRIAVSVGGINRWGEDKGKFTPEFMTQPYMDVLKMFRKLYDEKLINQDFAVLDVTEVDKMVAAGRIGMRLNVSALNVQGQDEKLWDVENFTGPKGIRIAGEPGNFGFLAIPKSAVKTEAELKKVLTFLDKLMDEPMSTLQMRGFEGKHFEKIEGNKTKYKDFNAFLREIKPYRDGLLNIEGYNVADIVDNAPTMKAYRLTRENIKYAVPNPALTLTSPTYFERGSELDLLIRDAETKYIMGKIDDAGFQAEVDKWKKDGGDKVIKEYEDSFAKLNKK